MRWLIYCRKSTDQDDKQTNSLEHQLQNCRNTLATLGFVLVKEIIESVSAKEEYKRAGFNEMIELCKKKQVDFIIIDEPKRLSRNNIDTSRIIDLMDKNMIRGIYATSRQYLASNSRDKFLLQLDLSLSKMDNEDRSNDVRAKMITCAKRGQHLGKAPYWYQNVTIRKWHKAVIPNIQEAEVVKTIFRFRKEWLAFGEIIEKVYRIHGNVRPFTKTSIFNIVHNRFYMGKVHFAWEEYDGQHEPIISKELFKSVQIHDKRWVYTWAPNMNDNYPLKGYLRDENGTLLNAYRTQGYLYYKSQSRSDKRVNISESRLYEELGNIVKEYDKKWSQFASFSQAIIWDLLEQKLQEKESILEVIAKDIHNKELRLSALLDMKLDEKVTIEIFDIKNAQLMKELEELKERKEKIETLKIEKIELIREKMVELSGSLYESYKSGNISQKSHILKSMMVELFVSTKKELTLAENKLFGFIKSCCVPYGAGNGTRTHNSRHGKAVL